MSVSALFGTKIAPTPLMGGLGATNIATFRPSPGCISGDGAAVVIECSSRPQKKSTAHHIKSRPKKTQAWDRKRGPAVYAPLPPLPAEWSFVSASSGEVEASSPPSSPPAESE